MLLIGLVPSVYVSDHQPAVTEVDSELPGTVHVELRDLGGRLDVPNDLVPLLGVVATDPLPREVALRQEVVEDVGQSLQVVPARLLLALQDVKRVKENPVS